MEYEVTRQPGCIAEIHVTLAPEDVSKYYGMAFDRLRNDARIPGFRPGKAPNVIIRKRMGEDALRDMAWLQIAEKLVPSIVEEAELKILGDPELKDIEKGSEGLAEGEPYAMDLVCTLEPIVELGEVSGLKLVKPDTEVKPEEIDETLAQLRETHSTLVAVDRVIVEPGDSVTAEVQTLLETGEDEEAELYQKAEQEIVIGSGKYQPALDDLMVGKSVGDEVETTYTFPEDYADPVLAGEEATIKAKIESLKARELPELDDAFAKLVGDEYESLEDLKKRIGEQLAATHEEFAKSEVEQQAFRKVLDGAVIDIPASMVDRLAQGSLQDMEADLEKDGFTLEMLAEAAGVTAEALAMRERAMAAATVRVHFLYDALVKKLEIEPEEEDINAAVADYAKETKTDIAFVRQAAAVQEDFTERMSERAKRNLVLKALVDGAEIETLPRDEYVSRREEFFEHVHGPHCAHEHGEEAPAEKAALDAGEPAELVEAVPEAAPEPVAAPEAVEASAEPTEAPAEDAG